MDLQPTPKELAINALNANQQHQYALARHVEKLSAQLAELDKLLPQADTEDGESELECDFYVPDAKPPVGIILKQAAGISFFQRRDEENSLFELHLPAKEVEALKVAVNAELRRVEQLEGGSSSTNDSQLTEKLDWSVIAEKVSDTSSIKRTAEECKIKWIGELSTAVNRGSWTTSEQQKLQQILKSKAKAKQIVNWVEVSKTLGTNRLPIDCMRQGLERPRHVWTPDADQKLLDAVKQYGTSWGLVARYVGPDVSGPQCSTRFLRTLDTSLRRGTWSAEEDKRLIAAVAGYGKSWAEVATVIPGRNSEQCRDRWSGNLDPAKASNKDDAWTEEEDKTLIEAVKQTGRKWKAIGIQIGRSATVCRLHYDKLNPEDFQLDSPSAGASTPQGEDEEIGASSGRSTPRPQPRKKKQSQLAMDSPLVAEPSKSKPRPRPVAKNSGTGRGTKRAAPDEGEIPRKKQVIEEVLVPDRVPQAAPEPDALVGGGEISQPTSQSAEPTTADTSVIPNSKKGKRRVIQVSTLPRRRSSRLNAEVDGGGSQS
ncbi:hypothetical protein B0H11DRAFT_2218359 [Mycena galericulata]|nr:hypothetical protein B0H11DRAFT_2218359 [Mycena galericulata]